MPHRRKPQQQGLGLIYPMPSTITVQELRRPCSLHLCHFVHSGMPGSGATHSSGESFPINQPNIENPRGWTDLDSSLWACLGGLYPGGFCFMYVDQRYPSQLQNKELLNCAHEHITEDVCICVHGGWCSFHTPVWLWWLDNIGLVKGT